MILAILCGAVVAYAGYVIADAFKLPPALGAAMIATMFLAGAYGGIVLGIALKGG